MIHGFELRDAVVKRYSVRTYQEKPIEPELLERLFDYASGITNPFGPSMSLQLIRKSTAVNGEKLGTYGIIRGADTFLAVTIADKPFALEALGYEFEQLVLYASSLGLGTCWLGGTFKRSAFASAIEVREGELFPVLSPIGYPKENKSFAEKIMRKATKADNRQPWEKLFYRDSFDNPLSQTEAGDYSYALEMLRLAPSAVNGQPWRLVLDGDSVHFFKKRSTASGAIDMQRIDIGIAMCHFDLAMQEKGVCGKFEAKVPGFAVPANLEYISSWKKY